MAKRALVALFALILPLLFIGNATRLLCGDWFLRYEYSSHPSAGAETLLELGLRGLEAVRPGGDGLSLLRQVRLEVGEGGSAFTNAEIRHMADVARLLEDVYGLHLLAAGAALALLALLGRRHLGQALVLGGLATLSLALLVGVYALVGFSSFFTSFHELLFDGNWRFPNESTLILVYPEWLWRDAAQAAVGLVLAQAASAVGLGLLLRRHEQHEPRRTASFAVMDLPLETTTDKGYRVTLRAAREEDAQRLLTHLDVIGPELNLKPGDLTITLEQERRLLRQYEESENSLFLIAEHEGLIAGSLTLYGGRRWSNAHVGQLGVSVRPDLRGSGIGSLLLETAIAWAREGGVVKRLEILSYETNERARSLYLRLGFEIEGLKRAAVMREGEYIDVYQMALLIGDAKPDTDDAIPADT